jgi:hypothetical protein
MKEILKRLAPLIDVAVVPAVLASAFILKQLRRAGVARMPLSRAALDWVGVLPVRDHYYEPLVVPPRSLAARLGEDRELPGLDLNVAAQLELLRNLRFADELAVFPRRKVREAEFYYDNDAFVAGDAEYFYSMLRHFKPRQLIEIGSGFSTLLARAALARNRAQDPACACRHICIEPYEMPWLERIEGLEVRRQRVEEVEVSLFEGLGANDILFIDSSHVIRPRGDVVFEYLEVLPRLKPGVLVHVHDIFTPKDYLARWVIEERRLWNEQYLLEAFLSCNERFEVVAALNYLAHHHPEELAAAAPVFGAARQHAEPGSFWIRRR